MTVTHTIGVFALGVVTLALSQYVVPEDLYPWLTVASGLMVVVVGGGVLRSRMRARRAAHAHAHDHAHDHVHVHVHVYVYVYVHVYVRVLVRVRVRVRETFHFACAIQGTDWEELRRGTFRCAELRLPLPHIHAFDEQPDSQNQPARKHHHQENVGGISRRENHREISYAGP